MPFDGPYGFHDAPWQTFPFGSPDYATQGSHGCVHLPENEAAWVYNWAPVGTTVTIRP
jgi:lipoprotein-anchoring transpeptidase ErfK/SrfK